MTIVYEREPAPKPRSKKPKPAGVGHNAAPDLDAGQVKSFFARWTRLEDERQGTSDDLKDLFAEAKGLRFSPKAMRAAFRHRRRLDQGKTPSAEEQAELELYLAALDALSDFVSHPSHAREATPKKPEVGHASKEGALAAQPGALSTESPGATHHPKLESAGPAPAHLLREGVTQ